MNPIADTYIEVPIGGSAPPTDSTPDGDSRLWLTPADLGNETAYGKGLRTTTTGYQRLDEALGVDSGPSVSTSLQAARGTGKQPWRAI